MANRPVNTGSGGAAAPPPARQAAATAHHAAAPASHRADRTARAGRDTGSSALGWLLYLIVLAGVAAGMVIAWQGSKDAGRGAGLIGASLLAGALARLILPERYAGLLASRRKAFDVLGFAVFGTAVLAVAIALP
jgi:hypothetical protein